MPVCQWLRVGFLLMLQVSPFVALTNCKRDEPSSAQATPKKDDEDEDESAKKKKKKKKVDDEDENKGSTSATVTNTATNVPTTPPIRIGQPKPLTTDAGTTSGNSDADKAKLQACCSMLRASAAAAGLANIALPEAGIAIPSFNTNKEELDKAVKRCDQQVIDWHGDLNKALSNVRGASPVRLPAACML